MSLNIWLWFGVLNLSQHYCHIIAQKAVSHVINSRALTGEKPCINKAIQALLMHGCATLWSYRSHRFAALTRCVLPGPKTSLVSGNYVCETSVKMRNNSARNDAKYEGCSKWIAYFYLETSNFILAQKYSFHALQVLPVARNAKFQSMYPLFEGVTVRWFGHSNKVLMNGRSKCLSGLVFPPSQECFQFRKQKEITWGKVLGIRGGGGGGWGGGWGKTVTFSFFKNAVTIA